MFSEFSDPGSTILIMEMIDDRSDTDLTRFLVLGLDLSLTGTGYAEALDGSVRPGGTFKPKGKTDLGRIRSVKGLVSGLLDHSPDLVCVEGLAYGSMVGKSSTRAGLWWSVVDLVDSMGVRIISCEPTRLKKFATGRGNATKDQMLLTAAKTFPDFFGDNNEADACWLASFGAYSVGVSLSVARTSYRDKAVLGYSGDVTSL